MKCDSQNIYNVTLFVWCFYFQKSQHIPVLTDLYKPNHLDRNYPELILVKLWISKPNVF